MRLNQRIRVAKVGGSLLSWSHVGSAFHNWLYDQPRMATLIIVGGGQAVEAMRTDPLLDPQTAHWQAIDLMSQNAAKFAQHAELPTWNTHIDTLQSLLSSDKGDTSEACLCVVLLAMSHLVRQFDSWPSLKPLPESWQVTSDSIAAQVGLAMQCSELVLLKSCDAPLPLDETSFSNETQERKRTWLRRLAGRGIVDAHFPSMADGLNVRLTNLRRYSANPNTQRS